MTGVARYSSTGRDGCAIAYDESGAEFDEGIGITRIATLPFAKGNRYGFRSVFPLIRLDDIPRDAIPLCEVDHSRSRAVG